MFKSLMMFLFLAASCPASGMAFVVLIWRDFKERQKNERQLRERNVCSPDRNVRFGREKEQLLSSDSLDEEVRVQLVSKSLSEKSKMPCLKRF